MNKWGNMLVGVVVGAVVVGGIWTGTHYMGTVAKVGNSSITKNQFEAEMETEAGGQVISNLIVKQLVTDAANKYKITASTKDINDQLTQLKQQYQITTDAQMTSFLTQNHITLAQLQDQMKTQVLMQKLAERNVKVSDTDIKNYYDQNKDQFTTPEQVTASHILVSTKAEADKVEQRLKNGESFATVAKDVSIDTSTKDKGGDLGTFGKGQMVPAFEKAAFALKPGTISDPVQTQYGWHVIKVTAHTQAKTLTLAQAKQQIIDAIQKQKAEPAAQLIAELAKSDPITVNNPAYSYVIDQLENPQTQQDQSQTGQ